MGERRAKVRRPLPPNSRHASRRRGKLDISTDQKTRVLFIERKHQGYFSLEKVFRQVAEYLPQRFVSSFQQASYDANLGGIIRNLLSFKPDEADVFHITGDITYLMLKLPPTKTVLTIHDLSILYYRTGLRRWIIKKLLFELPAQRAKYLTVISNATRDELIAQTGCDPQKIRVIENALDDKMKPLEKPPFNSKRPNILQVGTLPYKNIPNVIRAIEGLNCTLTIVGKPDAETTGLLEKANIKHKVVTRLEADGMREAYRTADIVTFCSVFEGFGLPVIEAQAMRTPLVTSKIDPMKSVAGDGALLVDPRNPNEIRKAIESIIADPDLREKIVERGAENVKRFDPATTAGNYMRIYEEITQSQ